MNDFNTFGFIFETLCIRDLRVFADALNGQYGLIEIKLGGDKLIEEGDESLKAMESKLDTGKMKAPAFLMILTGVGDYVYRRKDGVCVELLRRGYDVS